MDKEKMNNDPQNTSEEITERIEEMIEEETETGAGTVSISDRLREAEADENDYDADVEDGYDEAEYDEADGEVDGENEYGEASEDAEYVEDEYSEEEEEEDDDDEPRIVVNPKVVKVASLILFSGIILVFASIAWFTMNREVSTGGMGIKSQAMPYTIQTKDSSGYYKDKWDLIGSQAMEWKISSTKNFDNHENAKAVDETDPGIEPGDHGVLEFRVNPNTAESITVDCIFDIKAYVETTTTDENDQLVTEMTEITNSAIVGYLKAHIMLFSGIDANDKYTGLIGTDEQLRRVLEDLTYIKNGETYTQIYWVWPLHLNDLTSNDEDEIIYASSERQAVRAYMASNKNGFFKDCNDSTEQVTADLTTLSTEYSSAIYNHYNTKYDNADLEIGNNVSYVMLSMQVAQ